MMKRGLRLAALGLLLVVTVCLALATVLLGTGPGGSLLLRTAASLGDVALDFERFEGRLAGYFSIDGLAVSTPGAEVAIEDLHLNWQPWALLRGELLIYFFEAQGVKVLLDSAPAQADSALPDSVASIPEEQSGLRLPVPVTVGRVALERIELSMPGVVEVGSGTVELSGSDTEYRILLAGTVAAEGFPAALVRLAGTGDLRSARLDSALVDALGGTLAARGSLVWHPGLRWDLSFTADSIRPGLMMTDSSSLPGVASFEGRSEGDLDLFDLAVSGGFDSPNLPGNRVSLVARASARDAVIDSLALLGLGGSLSATGRVAWQPEVSWDLSLAARDVQPGLLLPDPASLPGEASLSGTSSGNLEQFKVVASGDFYNSRFPPGTLSLWARASSDRASIDSLTVSALAGDLRLSGSASWADGISWDLTLRGDSLQPGLLSPDSTAWPGWLSFAGQSSGSYRSDQAWPMGAIRLDTLSGALRGRELSGAVLAEADRRRVAVRRADLRWGAAVTTAEGIWGDSTSLTARVEIPDLSLLDSRAAGSLLLNLSGRGTLQVPELSASLRASELVFDSLSLAQLAAEVHLEADSSAVSELELEARGFTGHGFWADSVFLNAAGTRRAHTVALQLAAPQLTTAIEFEGGQDSAGWRGRLVEWLAQPVAPEVGEWRLASAASLAVSPGAVRLDSLCLEGAGTICVDARWQADSVFQAQVDMRALDLRMARLAMDSSWTVTGMLDADFDAVVDSSGGLRFSASALPTEVELSRRVSGRTRRATLDVSQAFLTGSDTGVVGRVSLSIADSVGRSLLDLSGELRLPEFVNIRDSLAPQPLTAELDVTVGDLWPLEQLSPRIDGIVGTARADLAFSGTVAEPSASGLAELRVSQLALPDLGVAFADVVLAAEGTPDGSFSIEGSATSAEGSVSLRGRAPARPTREDPASLTLTGDRFLAVNTTEVTVEVSPDIRIEATTDSVVVKGTVVIPRATIDLIEVPATAVPVSPDAVFIDSTVAGSEGPIAITSTIRLELGESVTFSGFDFRSEIQGSLLLEDRPHLPSSASGELRLVNGRYRAYGQDLQIERGVLRFSGPLDNPALDVRAFREARDRTLAGLDIRGTLQSPRVTIWSSPPMSQSQAISYLTTGRPIESDSDRSALADAAAAIGLQSAGGLTQGVGRDLGFDEAGVDASEGVDRAAFVVGKYLSPKLYVSYGVGLFDQINTFRVRYDLTRRISVQAESGRQNAADLLFTFERK